MTDVLDELQGLKTRLAETERRRAKTQADIDSLEGRLRESLSKMSKDFGADSVGVAKAMVSELEEDLSTTIKALREALEETA